MIVIIATCNTRKNTISVDILQGDIILKDWICWPFWLGGGVTCVPSCWTDFGSSLSHCLDFSGALYGVEELRTWNWKLWRLVLSGLVWPGCAWGAFCLVRVAGYLSFGAAKISRKLILWRILPQVWVEAMNFYFIPGSEDTFGMSEICSIKLLQQNKSSSCFSTAEPFS